MLYLYASEHSSALPACPLLERALAGAARRQQPAAAAVIMAVIRLIRVELQLDSAALSEASGGSAVAEGGPHAPKKRGEGLAVLREIWCRLLTDAVGLLLGAVLAPRNAPRQLRGSVKTGVGARL